MASSAARATGHYAVCCVASSIPGTEALGGRPFVGDAKVNPPALLEPVSGWRRGLERLVLECRCPWCGYPVLHIEKDRLGTLRWSCYDGCNP